jgi:hypothetical protein
LIQHNKKEFNIVTGLFYENNDEKAKTEAQMGKEEIYRRYWKTHDYDAVFGQYYDKEKEEQFQEERRVREMEHGKDYNERLPPSYHIPESMQTYDEKRMSAKKRYQLKYLIEDEYSRRNIEAQ